MTEVAETAANLDQANAAPEPAAAKRPRVAAHARHDARAKGKAGKRATAVKKAHTRRGSAKAPKKNTRARQGSKTAKVVELLKRPGGATGPELMKATGWQAHSVRGFISGVLVRRMGLKVSSDIQDGKRRYSLAA